MSRANLTIDDFDPLVVYSNYEDWQTPNPQDNPTWYNATPDVTNSQWHQATYHYTTVQGAKASVNFTGSGIYVYGATGPDKSNFTITLDPNSKNPSVTSHQTQNATEGRTLLFSSNELSYAPHTLEITNEGSGLLLDLIEVDMIMGGEGATLKNTTLDDRAQEIKYDGQWTQQNGPNFHDTTSTYTGGPGNAMEVNFTGSAIYVYGDQVNDHGMYTVSINGSQVGEYNGRSGCGGGYAKACEKLHGLAFFAGSLPEGTHMLRIENQGPAEGNKTFFDFDYLEYTVPSVWSTQPVGNGDCPFANCTASTSGSGATPDASGNKPGGSSGSLQTASAANAALFLTIGLWAFKWLV